MKRSLVYLAVAALGFACSETTTDAPTAGNSAVNASTPGKPTPNGTAPTPAAIDNPTVRLRTVFTPEDSGLLSELASGFQKETGYRVDIVNEEDVYGSARKGLADLVISHYGHKDVDTFVLERSGRWPQAVFSNQLALVGPASDPAHVKGLTDLAEAYRRIAESRAPFVANELPGLKYITKIVAEVDGNPDTSGWYHADGLKEEDAIHAAAKTGAYVLWGVTPFLKLKA